MNKYTRTLSVLTLLLLCVSTASAYSGTIYGSYKSTLLTPQVIVTLRLPANANYYETYSDAAGLLKILGNSQEKKNFDVYSYNRCVLRGLHFTQAQITQANSVAISKITALHLASGEWVKLTVTYPGTVTAVKTAPNPMFI
jgi:hypothetical protein